MARITSIVGRYTGVVTRADGTWGTWHCQMDCNDIQDLYWTVNELESQTEMAGIAADTAIEPTWTAVIDSLPIFISFTWTPFATPYNASAITDVVHHLSANATWDNGTEYPISITYERGQMINHIPFPLTLSLPDNNAEILAKIEQMLDLITHAVIS